MKLASHFVHLVLWLAGATLLPAWAQTAPAWSAIGPIGGSVTAIATAAAPNTLYAGTDANGVFLSTNGGSSWRISNNGLPVNAITGHRHVYALVSLGNFVYVALEGGVYVSAAGPSPAWTALPLPGNVAPACDFTFMTVVGSRLYLSSACESKVYATAVAGLSPVWTASSDLPLGNLVTGLGVQGSDIAAGSNAAVYLADRSGATLGWIDSESGLGAPVVVGPVSSLVSASSNSVFACALDGQLYQGVMASASGPTTWTAVVFSGAPAPSGCNGLAVVRVSATPQWVLVMATDTGAFVSTVFDAGSPVPVSMIPGPVFPLTSYVNAAVQTDPANLSALVWATEYGVYSSTSSSLTAFAMAVPTPLNGPAAVASPSQRLDNVNAKDIAAVGTSLFSIAESGGRPSYADVLLSTDGGASWSRTGLTTRFDTITRIRNLSADTTRRVVYAATDRGVYGFQLANGFWELVGNIYDVNAVAVGAQALYAGRDASASPNGGLVVQSLLGGTAFASVEVMPTLPTDFNVRTLAVSSGQIFAGGGVLVDPDALTYANAVYFTAEYVPGGAAPTWGRFGSGVFSATDLPVLSRLAVGNGRVFAGGEGFLRQSASSATAWSDVTGLPAKPGGGFDGVSALASDGTTLFVGTAGHGLLARAVDATSALVSLNGTGDTALASMVVSGLRIIDGRVYVATAAGLATASAAVSGSSAGSGSESWGGGCSMATAAAPTDPLLWLLVAIALAQVAHARRRRARQRGHQRNLTVPAPGDRP